MDSYFMIFLLIYIVFSLCHLIIARANWVLFVEQTDLAKDATQFWHNERNRLSDQLAKARAERDELANRLSRKPKRKPYHVK